MSGVSSTSEPLLTVEEVASLLHVPKRWVYQRAQRGDLPSAKVGRYLRFRRRDVVAFIDSRFSCGAD